MNHFASLKDWDIVPERTYDAAFLCWLIDSINRPEEEPGIKMAASRVLDLIFREEMRGGYDCVEIVRDYAGVPAVMVVNHTMPVILETGLLDQELLENVAKVKHDLRGGLCPAFTKPFPLAFAAVFDLRYRESGVGKDEIRDSVDVVVYPEDLLACMRTQPEPQTEAYQTYLSYLGDLVQKKSAYEGKAISQWDRFCYYGYFSDLEKKLQGPGTGWGYSATAYDMQRWFCWNVPVQGGYNLMNLDPGLVRLYFQIEIMKEGCELCVKCESDPENTTSTQTLWELYEAFQLAFQEKGYGCRKKRFLGGELTSVCAVEFEPSGQGDIIDTANEIYRTVVPELIAGKLRG